MDKTKKDKSSPQTNDKPSEKQKDAKPKYDKPSQGKAMLAIGLGVIAIMISALNTAQWLRTDNQLSIKQQNTSQTLSELASQFSNQGSQWSEGQKQFEQNLKQQTNQFEDKINQVQKQLETIAKQKSYRADDWQLQRALYFTELANFNTVWGQNPKTSIRLLEQADNIVKNLANHQLLPIRQALANEITQLNNLPQVDTIGSLSRLSAMADNIDALPLNNERYAHPEKDSNEAKQGNRWRSALDESWKHLKGLLVIRHHNRPIKPMLSSAQRQLLNERFKLIIQQAQWALIQKDQSLFEFNLKQAQSLLASYFDLNSSTTKTMQSQLQQLMKLPIHPKMPSITVSQNLIKQYLKNNANPIKQEPKA